MSSHIHLIIGRHGDPNLEHIIRDIKKYTSTQIIEAIKNNPQESRKELLLWLFERAGKANKNNMHYQFWQQDNHPIELNTNEIIEQRLNLYPQ
jgi:putative transposase